jgi:hypothetical protein
MVSAEHRAGRLIALRVETPVAMDELQAALIRFGGFAAKIEGKFIPVADCRGATVLSPDASERFIALMRNDNPRIERAGILLSASAASFSLQLERMVREAGNPRRRTFHAASQLCDWMGEITTPLEADSLRAFFG